MAQPMDLSPAGLQLGLGSLLANQSAENADELRRRRQLELQGRFDLTGAPGGLPGSLVGGP